VRTTWRSRSRSAPRRRPLLLATVTAPTSSQPDRERGWRLVRDFVFFDIAPYSCRNQGWIDLQKPPMQKTQSDEGMRGRWEYGECTGARVSFGRVARKHNRSPVELASAVVLPGRGRLVIMEACALSSTQRAALTACAFLPLPGIVG